MPMGRISVPSFPIGDQLNKRATISDISTAVSSLIKLLDDGAGDVLAISGAGMSVDSGIRAYRGAKGSYIINKSYRPIFFHEFLESHSFRIRYWARSYLGYPTVRVAKPNVGHYAVAALMKMGYIRHLITQNVDRLHHKAIGVKQDRHEPDYFQPHHNILELHGTLKHVNCLSCGHQIDRDDFQDLLSVLNPSWRTYADTLQSIGQEVKTNPDGDADVKDRSFDSFVVPNCEKCTVGLLKPAVTFFGESLSKEAKEMSNRRVAEATNLLLLGTSLTTYSAFRLVKELKEKKSGPQIGMINIGTTRADELLDWKIGSHLDTGGLGCSQVLKEVGLQLAARHRLPDSHPVMGLLNSGVIKPLD
ncbi:hypothetical protein MJO28_012318 [Puccinia striiformis f. sp. tritici]|uniref:Deacetylase sirtuin-type domain-containing protein n=3 Tax=Puccinia striiformis TaxID=27350 RepID=A0A0L0V8T8_9BASI|nr:hypothetical protein Pst134EB_023658 [Puccinia striiformis f. sp. tritici]KAI7942291.1 hypothetical protein MJO28_012318 [Puccinia striiformis f. sp. tritici]KNE95700.1 hypothetical protein PSTG_10919 [Puccinia striiformis f. sp. tritici PST-78]POW04619.1 hypothetical protein PSTT_10248 [Puccinia striiformis]